MQGLAAQLHTLMCWRRVSHAVRHRHNTVSSQPRQDGQQFACCAQSSITIGCVSERDYCSALTMPRVRPLAKAAMMTLGGGARATVATYRLALPMKLNIMLPIISAKSAVVTCGGGGTVSGDLHGQALTHSAGVEPCAS